MGPSFSTMLFIVTCILTITLSQHFAFAQSQDFRSCLTSALSGDSGRAKFPDSPSFGTADIKRYNLYFDIKPAAVVYPNSTQEVGELVKCASKSNIKVQARSGGHSFGDYCLGGISGYLVIDLKWLNQLSYDPADQTAHIGPGNHLEDVNKYMLKFGRRMPHGDAPQVGVGGHYTIGGLGRVSRQFGAAVDQIIHAEVVLADGSIVNASATENSDLFFAIRGAGASFGIVTDFHVKTSPAPGDVVAYTYNITIGDSKLQANAFKAWQKFISNPDLDWKISSQFIVLPVGSVITGFYFGTESEFSALNLQGQFSGIDNGAIDVHAVSGAVAVGNALMNLGLDLFGGVSAHFYSKSLPYSRNTLMSDTAIDAMFDYLKQASLPLNFLGVLWFVIFDLEAGAINQVPMNASAYAFRDTIYFLQSYAVDITGLFSKQTRSFLDGLNQVVQKNTPGIFGAYAGYVDPFLSDGPQQYWRTNLDRLQQIKKKLDPTQLFKNPQSVEPAP